MKPSFKLSSIFLCTLIPTSLVLAQATPCDFSGFTLGFGLGSSTFSNHASGSIERTNFIPNEVLDPDTPGIVINQTPTDLTQISTNPHHDGVLGRLFIGYGQVFDNHTYLGGELGVNFFSANDTKSKVSSQQTKVSYANVFGTFASASTMTTTYSDSHKVERSSVEPTLDLKLGFLITPTALAYIRGGINYNTIKIKNSGNITESGILTTLFANDPVRPPSFGLAVNTSSDFSSSHKKSTIGWRAGAGAEVMVTPNIGVSADYVYTWYPRVSTNSSATAEGVYCDPVEGCLVVPSTVSVNAKTTTHDQQVLAQLIYHFAV